MYVIVWIIIIENQVLVSTVLKNAMMVRLFTTAKLPMSTDLSSLKWQMPADNVVIRRIYHICHHKFGEVITLQEI